METGLRNWDSKGLLRVGASITIGSQFMPSYVCAYSNLYPEADVRVVVEQSDRLEKKILTNELDFALIEGIAHDSSIKSEAYMEDHLSIVCPANGKWKQGQIISVEEFKKQRFLLRERGSGTREVFERVIGQTGFSVSPVWEAMSTTALVNAVINGLGIAVLPHRMVLPAMERGLVVTIGVDGMRFQRNFYIIHHKDISVGIFCYSCPLGLSRLANLVYSGNHASSTVPIGPFLCLAIIISETPFLSVSWL